MDLRDLNYFEVIAELGHLGRAAERLNRSQPALSKSIQRLEESLGTRLFDREGRRIKLTAVGELLLSRSRQLQQNVADTQREVRDFASGAIGNIRLGCASSMAEHLLPQLAGALLERAPLITLKLSIGQDDMLRDSLRNGRLDAIISPLRTDDTFTSYPILDDQAVVVANAQHPVFQRQQLKLADLCQYRWVLPGPGVNSRNWIDNVFTSAQLPPPQIQIETNSVSMLPRLIARTQLLSFMPREMLEQGQGWAALREVALAQTTMARTLAVSVRAGAYLPPATVAMLDMLRSDGQRYFTASSAAE